jgi:MFS family permease
MDQRGEGGSLPGEHLATASGRRTRFRRSITSGFSTGFGPTAITYLIGHIVEQSTWIATVLFAYERSGTKTAGIISAAILVVAALSAPFQGKWLDRYEPFRATRALLVAQAVAGLMLVGAATVFNGDGVVWVAAALFACLQTCAVPVVSGVLPTIARGGEALAAQNAVFGWVESAGLIIGPLLAAVTLRAANSTRDGLVLTSCIGTGLVIIAISLVHRFASQEVSRTGTSSPLKDRLRRAPQVPQMVSTDSHDVVALRQVPALRTMLLLTFGSFLTLGALDVLYLPVAARSGLSESQAGLLAAAYGTGGLLSYFAARWIVGRRRLIPAIVVAGLLGSAAIGGLAFSQLSSVGVVVLVIVAGGCRSVFGVIRRTLVQRSAPAGTLLRVTSKFQVAVTLGLAVGALVPWLAGSTTRACLVTAALVPLVLCLTAPRLRAVDDAADVPVTEIALLGQVAIMRSLRPASLEALARQCHSSTYRRGLPIITEGEPGVEMYVLVDGEVEVLRGSTRVGHLTRGEMFGEVAILRDQPRNATITSLTDVKVLAIPRQDFIRFVGLHDRVASALDQVVEERSVNPSGRDAS